MALPADVRVFEIDLPELFAVEEPVLAAAHAEPRCDRAVLSVDLREDWAKLLRDHGLSVRMNLPECLERPNRGVAPLTAGYAWLKRCEQRC